MRATVENYPRDKFTHPTFVFLAALTVLFTCGAFAPSLAGVDVRVNQDVGVLLQNETSITNNRGLPGNIVVGYNEAPGSAAGLGISYSFNLGLNWADSQTQSVWGVEADPAVASDLLGNVFAAMISYAAAGPMVFPITASTSASLRTAASRGDYPPLSTSSLPVPCRHTSATRSTSPSINTAAARIPIACM